MIQAAALLAVLVQLASPPTVVPVSSHEDRAAAAGWGTGTWMDQHDAINAIGDTTPDLQLVFLGDSITQSWGGPGRTVGSKSRDLWNERWGDVRAASFGISGDRTQHLLWRIDHGNLEGIHPDVTVLMIGTNNLAHDSADAIAAGVRAVVERLRARTEHIVVCSIVRGLTSDDPLRQKADAVNAAVRPIGHDGAVTWIEMADLFYHEDGSADRRLLAGDGVHFTESGYAAWADLIEPAVRTAIQSPHVDDLQLVVSPLPNETRAAFSDLTPRRHVFCDPDWYTWGASVERDAAGVFHMFCARWRHDIGFLGWLTHSEIVHATARHAAGPYVAQDTAMTGRGEAAWDRVTAHNPKIKRADDRWYLYYIATTGPFDQSELLATARGGYRHPNWSTLRNAQRTGVAVAEHPAGPWQRSEAPIVEPAGPITTLTVNPAVTQAPDGTWLMIVKGDKPDDDRFIRHQAVATAPTPEGPFTIQPRPALDAFDSEDASIWFDVHRQRFYAVYHTGDRIGLLTSRLGRIWRQASQPLVTRKVLRFEDGTSMRFDRFERPFVLLDDHGQPGWLFVALRKGDAAWNVALSIKDASREDQPPAGE